MIKQLISAAAVTTTIFAAIGPTSASAAEPVVIVEEDFENTFFSPAEQDPCGVDTTVHEVGSVKITEFYDNDGNLNRARTKVMATTTVTTDFGQLVDRWSQNTTFDPETLTDTVTGNVFNTHAGAGGVLVNDSGRIVIDVRTGEALVVNGPHQAWFGEFDDACAVLAP
jgi:hypothetical protein